MGMRYHRHRSDFQFKRAVKNVAEGSERPKTCDFDKVEGLYASDLRSMQRKSAGLISAASVRRDEAKTGIRRRVSRIGQGRIRGPQTKGTSRVASLGFENKEHRS